LTACHCSNASHALVAGPPFFSPASPTRRSSHLADGPLTVVISPYDFQETGSFTLTYATDVTAALSSGVPVNGTLSYAGQHADYTFTGVANQHVTLAITNPLLQPTGGRLVMNVYNASNALVAGPAFFSTGPNHLDFAPTAGGPFPVAISPHDFPATGSFTLTYATDATGS